MNHVKALLCIVAQCGPLACATANPQPATATSQPATVNRQPAVLLYSGPRRTDDATLSVGVRFEKITFDDQQLEVPEIKEFPFTVGLQKGRHSFLTTCNKKTPITLDAQPNHAYSLDQAVNDMRTIEKGGQTIVLVSFDCVLKDETSGAILLRLPAELQDKETQRPSAPPDAGSGDKRS